MKRFVFTAAIAASFLAGMATNLEDVFEEISTLPDTKTSERIGGSVVFAGLRLHNPKMIQINSDGEVDSVAEALEIAAAIPEDQRLIGGFQPTNTGVVYFDDTTAPGERNMLIINKNKEHGVTTVVFSEESADYIKRIGAGSVMVNQSSLSFSPLADAAEKEYIAER